MISYINIRKLKRKICLFAEKNSPHFFNSRDLLKFACFIRLFLPVNDVMRLEVHATNTWLLQCSFFGALSVGIFAAFCESSQTSMTIFPGSSNFFSLIFWKTVISQKVKANIRYLGGVIKKIYQSSNRALSNALSRLFE